MRLHARTALCALAAAALVALVVVDRGVPSVLLQRDSPAARQQALRQQLQAPSATRNGLGAAELREEENDMARAEEQQEEEEKEEAAARAKLVAGDDGAARSGVDSLGATAAGGEDTDGLSDKEREAEAVERTQEKESQEAMYLAPFDPQGVEYKDHGPGQLEQLREFDPQGIEHYGDLSDDHQRAQLGENPSLSGEASAEPTYAEMDAVGNPVIYAFDEEPLQQAQYFDAQPFSFKSKQQQLQQENMM